VGSKKWEVMKCSGNFLFYAEKLDEIVNKTSLGGVVSSQYSCTIVVIRKFGPAGLGVGPDRGPKSIGQIPVLVLHSTGPDRVSP
jgi:hypothetical protein